MKTVPPQSPSFFAEALAKDFLALAPAKSEWACLGCGVAAKGHGMPSAPVRHPTVRAGFHRVHCHVQGSFRRQTWSGGGSGPTCCHSLSCSHDRPAAPLPPIGPVQAWRIRPPKAWSAVTLRRS